MDAEWIAHRQPASLPPVSAACSRCCVARVYSQPSSPRCNTLRSCCRRWCGHSVAASAGYTRCDWCTEYVGSRVTLTYILSTNQLHVMVGVNLWSYRGQPCFRVVHGSLFLDPTRPDPPKRWPDPTRPTPSYLMSSTFKLPTGNNTQLLHDLLYKSSYIVEKQSIRM